MKPKNSDASCTYDELIYKYSYLPTIILNHESQYVVDVICAQETFSISLHESFRMQKKSRFESPKDGHERTRCDDRNHITWAKLQATHCAGSSKVMITLIP